MAVRIKIVSSPAIVPIADCSFISSKAAAAADAVPERHLIQRILPAETNDFTDDKSIPLLNFEFSSNGGA